MAKSETDSQNEGDLRYQKQWLTRKRQELISASQSGDELRDQQILQEIISVYGEEFAVGWRLEVLERYAKQRIDDTLNSWGGWE